MPFKSGNAITKTSFKKGHIRSVESRLKQSKTMKGRINWLAIKKMNSPESNKKKGHKGEKNPKWIKDRTKLKQYRYNTEEKWFIRDIIKERNYKCELTGNGGQLSVHHIKPVWKYSEERFNKNNCIVIKKDIHLFFHKLYGFKSDELDWCQFITNKEYESIY